MHRLLERQLLRLGLSADAVPSREAWQNVLEQVEAAYQLNDQDRHLLERSLELTSAELVERNEQLSAEVERQKKAANGLAQSLSLNAATLEATDDGILVVDLKGQVAIHNKKFLELWKLPPDAPPDDEALLDAILPQLADPKGFVERVEQLYAAPEETSFEVIEFLDGRIFERFSHPQRIGDRVVGRVWSFRDVTARRRSEEALRIAQDRLRSIVQSAPLVVFALDRAGRFTLCEGRPLGIMGLSALDHVGRSAFDLYAAHPRLTDNLRRALDGDAFTDIIEVKGMHFETYYSPTRDVDGRITGIFGVANDVTERLRLEKEAAEQRELLNRAARLSSLGTLVAGVAHEINNPLMYINGHLELVALAAAALPEQDETRRISDSAQQALLGTERIAKITVALKVIARGGHAPKSALVLDDVAKGVQDLVTAGLPANVRLERNGDGARTEVRANGAELHQVVLNLVQNAVQALGTRGGTVRIRASAEDGHALLEVLDDGPGMPPDTQAQAFTPFYTTRAGGTGLGLSIAHAIVVEHGGDLTFTSAPGQGTRFTMRLPLAPRTVPVASLCKV